MASNDTSSADSAPAGSDDAAPPASTRPSTSTPRDDVAAASGAKPESPEHPDTSASHAPTSSAAPRAPLAAHGRALNPRSCVTCRRRKVKCDKTDPCLNCTRAHIQCIFPSPGRAPRKSRKVSEHGRDGDLLDRLRRLEGVVKGMGIDVPGDARDRGEKGSLGSRPAETSANTMEPSKTAGQTDPMRERDSQMRGSETDAQQPASLVESADTTGVEHRFGRLVVNEGKSRYINNSYWASLSTEVEDLKGLLNRTSDDDDSAGQDVDAPSKHHGWIFGFSTASVDLLSFHPMPGQIRLYWETYKDRVDLVAKVLHIPTIEGTVLSAASHLSHLSKGFQALLFTIYYAATTSTSAEECLSRFGESRPVLLSRYRFAVEQALARANFLVTEEVVVLQAFVIFLICLRRNTDGRIIWTLTGLIVRIAQTMGIHRDGTHFGLRPFDVEIRRRLWWQACILDVRASEDHGCDPTIVEQSFDTRMPLNINDADMTPDMEAFPPEHVGTTDMSFCLIRFEVSDTFRRINYNPPLRGREDGRNVDGPTMEDKLRWVTESQQRLENKYLKHCDMSVPIFWVTATVTRMIMTKMWLMVYHPFQRQHGTAALSKETYDKLFIASLENIEYSVMLETEVRTMKWGWLFRTYMQWHALAFLLTALCKRTTGDMVSRAWVAVNNIRDGRLRNPFPDDNDEHPGELWRPLKKLYSKARDAREAGLRKEALAKGAPPPPPSDILEPPPRRTYSPNANPMFGHPARPQPTRAPLSQAQLRRFTEGPALGQLGQTISDLRASSRGSDTGMGEAMAVVDASAIYTQPLPSYGMDGRHYTAPSTLAGAANLPPQTQPLSDSAPFAPGLSVQGLASLGDVLQQHSSSGNSIDAAATNTDLDVDTSALMDTSGDLNWDNWDQLVRQFGMDVDGRAPAASTDAAASSSTAEWPVDDFDYANANVLPAGGFGGPNPANQRMGMGLGMGMGEWI